MNNNNSKQTIKKARGICLFSFAYVLLFSATLLGVESGILSWIIAEGAVERARANGQAFGAVLAVHIFMLSLPLIMGIITRYKNRVGMALYGTLVGALIFAHMYSNDEAVISSMGFSCMVAIIQGVSLIVWISLVHPRDGDTDEPSNQIGQA